VAGKGAFFLVWCSPRVLSEQGFGIYRSATLGWMAAVVADFRDRASSLAKSPQKRSRSENSRLWLRVRIATSALMLVAATSDSLLTGALVPERRSGCSSRYVVKDRLIEFGDRNDCGARDQLEAGVCAFQGSTHEQRSSGAVVSH
jgi:hypothetical protein